MTQQKAREEKTLRERNRKQNRKIHYKERKRKLDGRDKEINME